MKLKIPTLSLTLLLVILTGFLVSVPSARAQQTNSLSTTLTGSLPLLGPYSFDVCNVVTLGLISCSVSMLVAEVYKQQVTLTVDNSTSELQIDGTATTGVTLSADQPVQTVDLNFTYSGKTYSFAVPLPSLQVPGSFNVQIPIGTLVANFLGAGLIGSIINNIAGLNLNLNYTSKIDGVLGSNGFALTNQKMTWNTQSVDSVSSTLSTVTNDAALSVQELDAESGLSASLVLNLLSLTPVTLFGPVYTPLLQLGSTNTPISLGHWFHLIVGSPFSQTTGSGWYLSGTTASFSVAQTSVDATGGTNQFKGWTGVGTAAYTGTQQSESLTVTGPANETAGWTFVPTPTQASSNTPGLDLGPMTWALGIATAALLVAASVLVIVVLVRRSKPRPR